jgi:hypothetical protein
MCNYNKMSRLYYLEQGDRGKGLSRGSRGPNSVKQGGKIKEFERVVLLSDNPIFVRKDKESSKLSKKWEVIFLNLLSSG